MKRALLCAAMVMAVCKQGEVSRRLDALCAERSEISQIQSKLIAGKYYGTYAVLDEKGGPDKKRLLQEVENNKWRLTALNVEIYLQEEREHRRVADIPACRQ